MSVVAEVNYVRNAPPEGAPPLTFVTEAEEHSTMVTRPGQLVPIHDVRGTDTSLDVEGFVLVPHRSAVADFGAIEEDPAVDQLYIDEMTAFIRQLTGAAQVIMLGGGKKRFGESAAERLAPLKNAKPARYAHGDVTDKSGPELAAMMVGDELVQVTRWAMYNMWRSVTPPPQDHPLAVCDSRTVATADGLTVVAVTETRGGGDFSFDTTGYRYRPGYRWCYFRDMTPDEVLVFKTHETDPAKAHRVPHTAFTDPSCPAGTPTRASVEMRALALYR